MNDDLQNFNERLMKVEQLLARSPQLEEMIRDIVIFNADNSTATTQNVTVGAGGGSFTVPANPDYYLKVYYKGNVALIPAFRQK